MVEAAQVGVDDGACCIGAHSYRADNMTRTLNVRRVLNILRAQRLKHLFMRAFRSFQTFAGVVVEIIVDARQRNTVGVALFGIKRDAVFGVR